MKKWLRLQTWELKRRCLWEREKSSSRYLLLYILAKEIRSTVWDGSALVLYETLRTVLHLTGKFLKNSGEPLSGLGAWRLQPGG